MEDKKLFNLGQFITYMLIIVLVIMSNIAFGQSDVPTKHWIDDSNFEEKINIKEAFGDDNNKPVVVEFWAKFNEVNCFAQWEELEDVVYYRVDIAKAPEAKKKYKVRMAPTLIIYKDGFKEEVFKAGLDLTLPADLEDIQEAINEVNNASKF
jgi:thiol-disulfide isomerase/thioredoxin